MMKIMVDSMIDSMIDSMLSFFLGIPFLVELHSSLQPFSHS